LEKVSSVLKSHLPRIKVYFIIKSNTTKKKTKREEPVRTSGPCSRKKSYLRIKRRKSMRGSRPNKSYRRSHDCRKEATKRSEGIKSKRRM